MKPLHFSLSTLVNPFQVGKRLNREEWQAVETEELYMQNLKKFIDNARNPLADKHFYYTHLQTTNVLTITVTVISWCWQYESAAGIFVTSVEPNTF